MNKRPIDKTKKSNIYCSHCKFWCEENKHFYCNNLNSKHCNKQRNYWNRCKQFEWAEIDPKESEG